MFLEPTLAFTSTRKLAELPPYTYSLNGATGTKRQYYLITFPLALIRCGTGCLWLLMLRQIPLTIWATIDSVQYHTPKNWIVLLPGARIIRYYHKWRIYNLLAIKLMVVQVTAIVGKYHFYTPGSRRQLHLPNKTDNEGCYSTNKTVVIDPIPPPVATKWFTRSQIVIVAPTAVFQIVIRILPFGTAPYQR